MPKKVDNRFVVNNTLAAPMTLDRGTPDADRRRPRAKRPVVGQRHVAHRRHQPRDRVCAGSLRLGPAPADGLDLLGRRAMAISAAGHRRPSAAATRWRPIVTRQTDNSPLVGWMVRYADRRRPRGRLCARRRRERRSRDRRRRAKPRSKSSRSNPWPARTRSRFKSFGRPASGRSESAAAARRRIDVAHLDHRAPLQAPRSPADPNRRRPCKSPASRNCAAQLDVTLSGPETAVVGSDVQFEIEVVNRGAAPATRLVGERIALTRDWNMPCPASPIERDLADLPPGGTSRLNVTFRVAAAGQLCQEITVTGERRTACDDARLHHGHRAAVASNQPRPAQPPPNEPAPRAAEPRPAKPAPGRRHRHVPAEAVGEA